MIKEIDARGENCPKPFIMTKKALDEIQSGTILTIVDNEVAKENVSKLAKSIGLEYNVESKEGDFYITINKDSKETTDSDHGVCDVTNFKDNVILFTKNKMGHGNDELGKVLIKGYIYTLTELEEIPKTLLFVNGGVLLTTEGSEVINDLKKLEEKGVKIVSCGTCLDYYDLKEKLLVGEIGNMYVIADEMNNAQNTITL
ncbi:selenium metabolism protein, SirA-like protein [Gottschalkia acidurici 9a]|uniref:Selenium metabolism protein, SirA-like protein n=1 Tax=Gottschalkia acidurici (strain ATCC 7906 / DSM 604 / BCRC 14475 / CIP 104303 / KCTC 5404 / NCIMB 10678 / 9a) TaxID=1128398 RepID=K0B4K7_GOTA9|nr:sulfurtransferase-like selenium metabolism protein YedF [Gottschalkia acidurici]AFS79850.1 selenium metabolism protein, SirA-like protein [Gottschalkia acidurici 9a]